MDHEMTELKIWGKKIIEEQSVVIMEKISSVNIS